MKTLLGVLALILIVGCKAAFPQSTKNEVLLKQYFEGKRVTLKIDMPATKNGVNVNPERDRPLDFSDYASRLKRFGTAIRAGESAMVTNVKVKGKHIEFHLDGGGYGTFGDDTGTA